MGLYNDSFVWQSKRKTMLARLNLAEEFLILEAMSQ